MGSEPSDIVKYSHHIALPSRTVSCAAMTCPFLSRLPSQFVKNYSSKLLKTYGEHCPVASTAGHSLLNANKEPAPVTAGSVPGVQGSKCPMAGISTGKLGENSPIRPIESF